MKKYFKLSLWIIFVSFLPFISIAQSTINQRYFHLIIGTYTKTQDKGLFVYKFDSETGKLTFESTTEGIKNPSYLAVGDDGKKVYSVNESGTDRKGGVSAFNFDAKLGKLNFINEQETIGAAPCYISISKDNKFIITANYTGGNLSVLPLATDGKIEKLTQLIQHDGSSVNQSRQKEPHAHSAIFSPNGKTLFSADLGTDKLYAYQYKSNNPKPLVEAKQPLVKTEAGFGPRHFEFNKKGSKVYLLGELTGAISVYDRKKNQLENIQSLSLNTSDFKGTNGAADIHLSNDEKFLYVTNRGSVNEIVIFKVHEKTGLLERIGAQSTLGKTPRNFMIDPTDQFLLIAHQNSDDVLVFKRDKNTGMLTYANEKINVGSPVCLKMTAVIE
jgi:6-phosphogluconolactonase